MRKAVSGALVLLVACLTLATSGCSSGTSPSEVWQMQGRSRCWPLPVLSFPNQNS